MNGLKLVYYLLNDKLYVNSESILSLRIYDLAGRLISENSISTGNNIIDVFKLTKKHVILSFESEEGQITSKKILIP